MSGPDGDALVRLAEFHGISTTYRDVDDREQRASVDALLATLHALGIDVPGREAAPDALLAGVRDRWARRFPPVATGFGDTVPVQVRMPARARDAAVELTLTLENGDQHGWTEDLSGRSPEEVAVVDGVDHHLYALTVKDLPYGYHRLAMEHGGEVAETLLIAAPPRAYPGPVEGDRSWGVFLPWYALRTARDWGTGDVADLAQLGEWVASLGGRVVGTLPVLPLYLSGDGADPSPYSPVSRLFWSELIIDPTAAPEYARSPAARDLVGSAGFVEELRAARSAGAVDYRALEERRRRVLQRLSDVYFAEPGDRRGDLEWFIAQRPEVERYALFRGAVARYGTAWWDWPPPARDRQLDLEGVDLPAARYHLYAQLVAREQVAHVADRLRSAGLDPYLDLPLGARRDGFDVWEHREVFATDASTGAPPDTIFTGGQNWRFPPLHPERLRETGYRYLIDVLRHHLGLADILRVDHVMALHRLFWIPEGIEARDGVYVRYPVDDLYAIFALESHRHRSWIVGEDLGTVPDEVEDALRERGVGRMYVVQYEADPDAYDVLEEVPRDAAASVNTHDMPPFAAFWEARDIDDSVDLGLLGPDGAERSRDLRSAVRWKLAALLSAEGRLDPERSEDPAAVLEALLEWLGASDAAVVLVNLEDLWLERRAQNTPGTDTERVNWRRRAALSLEEVREHPAVLATLRRLNAAREGVN